MYVWCYSDFLLLLLLLLLLPLFVMLLCCQNCCCLCCLLCCLCCCLYVIVVSVVVYVVIAIVMTNTFAVVVVVFVTRIPIYGMSGVCLACVAVCVVTVVLRCFCCRCCCCCPIFMLSLVYALCWCVHACIYFLLWVFVCVCVCFFFFFFFYTVIQLNFVTVLISTPNSCITPLLCTHQLALPHNINIFYCSTFDVSCSYSCLPPLTHSTISRMYMCTGTPHTHEPQHGQ